MNARRWLILISAILLAVGAATLYVLPGVVRQVATARIQAITKRPVSIDRVALHLLSGRLTIHGFHLAEADGATPFADFEQLDAQVHVLSLLRGHLWVRDAVLRKPTVRVVRLAKDFNLSDLIESSGTVRPFDVTVDRFALVDGTIEFEDRALPEWRTWTSDNIQIEARNVSTRRDDGTAVGSSVTAGAPTSVEIRDFRLYPIHLKATVMVKGLDLALARLYLPPDAPVVLDRGRVSSSLKVALDARAGVRADLTGEFEDLLLLRPGERDPVAHIRRLTAQLTDFAFQDEQLRIGRFELRGSASVRDPSTPRGARYQVSAVRASIEDLTWPVTIPGRLDVLTAIPGGGTLAASGMLRPPPAPSQLRLRLSNLDLAPWNRFLPGSAKINGLGEADLRIDEPLAVGVPTRVNGSIAVNRLGVNDARQEVMGARRVEAMGLEVQWPTRLGVQRAIVERDAAGGFALRALWSRPAEAPTPTKAPDRGSTASMASLSIDVGEIAVRDGALSWRDDSVKPRAALDFAHVEATVTGGRWPLRRPLGVRASGQLPGGGHVQVAGRVGVDPFSADVRVNAKDAELHPYYAYVPTRAQFGGRADLDLAVVVPDVSELRATVRGNAALSRVDVRDGQRTVLRIERAAATALDVDWPRRVHVRQLALQRPWILLERDASGALPLRALLPTPTTGAAPTRGAPPPTSASTPGGGTNGQATIPVVLGQLVIDGGGARVVDGGVTPPFAVDLASLALRMDGLSTAPGAKPARMDLKARVGTDGLLSLHGTIGPVRGPLRVDLDGELREFAMPRTNPYLLSQVAWEARDGWLTTSLRCRIDGDNLDAKTEILLSRLQVARASGNDEAQARIGLPLGTIISLMKDRRGDIHLALPVGGRLSDPRFDFREVIWSTLRNAAVKAIMAPVSWIGRVQFGADSRIQRIEVDPIPFEPGTATPTLSGQDQVTRLVAFLDQTPEARMTVTAVVSRLDIDAMRQPAVDAAIERVARDARISPDAAAARVFQERFPRRPLPETADALRAALLESETPPAEAVSALADKRLEAMRATVKKAGIDPSRLLEAKRAEGTEGDDPQVKLDLMQPETPRRPGRRAPEFLRRLTRATDTASPPAR